MVKCSGLLLIAVLLATCVPALARAADQPVATAPIPPPAPPPSVPDKPFVVVPHAPAVPATPQTRAAKPMPPTAEKPAQKQKKLHTATGSRHLRHLVPHRIVARRRAEPRRFVAQPMPPPAIHPPPRRYYAGNLPPGAWSDGPPPWYGYYMAPWRRGPEPW